MIDSITNNTGRVSRKALSLGGAPQEERSFSERIKGMLEDVNTKQHTADADAKRVIKGELGIQEGMMSLNEADISLRYLVQVRAKVMAAYNEIIKMAV